jgi:hypothetical protein
VPPRLQQARQAREQRDGQRTARETGATEAVDDGELVDSDLNLVPGAPQGERLEARRLRCVGALSPFPGSVRTSRVVAPERQAAWASEDTQLQRNPDEACHTGSIWRRRSSASRSGSTPPDSRSESGARPTAANCTISPMCSTSD